MAAKLLYATVLVAVCATFTTAFPRPSYEQQQHAAQQHYDNDDGKHEHDNGGDVEQQQHEAPRSYHFQYAVHDPTTGDVKSQNEVGDGRGTVKGTYSILEADGSTRVVEYTADDEHGFRAEVKRIEPQHDEPVTKQQASIVTTAEPTYKFDYPEHLVQQLEHRDHDDAVQHVHYYYPGETSTATH